MSRYGIQPADIHAFTHNNAGPEKPMPETTCAAIRPGRPVMWSPELKINTVAPYSHQRIGSRRPAIR